MGSEHHRRDLLYATPVVMAIAIIAYMALTGAGTGASGQGSTGADDAATSLRWELASEIANLTQEGGVPRGLAECIGERVAISSTHEQLHRMSRDPEYRQVRAEVEAPRCERAYVGPPRTPEPRPITIDPQASPSAFANAVDAICAVDFDQALDQEAEIESSAAGENRSQNKVEAAVAVVWAGSQAETADYVANLGTPPSSAETVERWRENVARRGRMFGEKGKALARGELAQAERIRENIIVLKEEADRLGDSFGLRVCTSN